VTRVNKAECYDCKNAPTKNSPVPAIHCHIHELRDNVKNSIEWAGQAAGRAAAYS
jgi:hypothetical protein